MSKVDSNRKIAPNSAVPYDHPAGSMSIKRFLTPSNREDSIGTLEHKSHLGSGLGPSGGLGMPSEGVKIIGISNKRRDEQQQRIGSFNKLGDLAF